MSPRVCKLMRAARPATGFQNPRTLKFPEKNRSRNPDSFETTQKYWKRPEKLYPCFFCALFYFSKEFEARAGEEFFFFFFKEFLDSGVLDACSWSGVPQRKLTRASRDHSGCFNHAPATCCDCGRGRCELPAILRLTGKIARLRIFWRKVKCKTRDFCNGIVASPFAAAVAAILRCNLCAAKP